MTDTHATTTTYRIPAHKLDGFKAVIERVSRKATKLGLDPITYRVSTEDPASVIKAVSQDGTHTYETTLYVDPANVDTVLASWNTNSFADVFTSASLVGTTTIYTVEVLGQEPFLDGWTFVATIDHADTGNVVSAVPGQTAIEVANWVSAPANCDHCKLVRDRLKTYVLVDENGTTIQLGSTCIKDFFPGLAAEQIARLAELLVTIDLTAGSYDWEDGGRGSKFEGWLRETVVTVACAAVREYGFTSKRIAEEYDKLSTADRVETHLTRKPGDKVQFTVTDEDSAKATRVIEWVEALSPTSNDDYLWNLQSAIARPVTTGKLLGLVVSAVSALDRETQKQVEKEAEKWVPVPDDGARHQVTGKILSTRVDEGFTYNTYVTKCLVLVDTPEGNYKVWGTLPVPDAEVGDTVTFAARLTRSDDDETFGFYKRPTKASIVYPEGTVFRCQTTQYTQGCDRVFASKAEAAAEDEATYKVDGAQHIHGNLLVVPPQ
jgi:hypothetical protein